MRWVDSGTSNRLEIRPAVQEFVDCDPHAVEPVQLRQIVMDEDVAADGEARPEELHRRRRRFVKVTIVVDHRIGLFGQGRQDLGHVSLHHFRMGEMAEGSFQVLERRVLEGPRPGLRVMLRQFGEAFETVDQVVRAPVTEEHVGKADRKGVAAPENPKLHKGAAELLRVFLHRKQKRATHRRRMVVDAKERVGGLDELVVGRLHVQSRSPSPAPPARRRRDRHSSECFPHESPCRPACREAPSRARSTSRR